VTLSFLSPNLYIRSDDTDYATITNALATAKTDQTDSDGDGTTDYDQFVDGLALLTDPTLPTYVDPTSTAFTTALGQLINSIGNTTDPTGATGTGSGALYTALSGVGAATLAGEAYVYTPGTAITADGHNTGTAFNSDTDWGWSLTMKGVPAAGDTYTVERNPYPQLDASNAQAMLDLRDKAMFDKAPLTDGYASLIADIGTRTQGALQTATVSQQLATTAEQARTAVSGVNLDEEAARLMQYQQAYQAAGKAMQVANSLFDTLLDSIS
jgi:flagellar hook-associated protein 1 FlgK